MELWISFAVGKMHINKISNIMLARKLGWSCQYVSEILNGKRTPKKAQEKIEKAIDELISERRNQDEISEHRS